MAADLDGEGSIPEDSGLFCGDETLETDLFAASDENQTAIITALGSFPWSDRSRQGIGPDMELLPYLEKAGKGRFAQRLATTANSLDAPEYIRKALEHLMA